MNKGFILLECVISIFLITLLLLPIQKLNLTLIKLNNPYEKRQDYFYYENISKEKNKGFLFISKNTPQGSFSNIGMKTDFESIKYFYIFESSSSVFQRNFTSIVTPLSSYKECP